jgi:hypothetical protein
MHSELQSCRVSYADIFLAVDAHVPDSWALPLMMRPDSKMTLGGYIDLASDDGVIGGCWTYPSAATYMKATGFLSCSEPNNVGGSFFQLATVPDKPWPLGRLAGELKNCEPAQICDNKQSRQPSSTLVGRENTPMCEDVLEISAQDSERPSDLRCSHDAPIKPASKLAWSLAVCLIHPIPTDAPNNCAPRRILPCSF